MILDSLLNASLYIHLSARMGAGLQFLNKTNFLEAQTGRVEIAQGVFALIDAYLPRRPETGFFESHRQHIDIQFIAAGIERIGWAPIEAIPVAEPFDPARDLIKYAGQPDQWLTLRQGMFAIFFPSDAHMPGIEPAEGAAQMVRKVVVKVAV